LRLFFPGAKNGFFSDFFSQIGLPPSPSGTLTAETHPQHCSTIKKRFMLDSGRAGTGVEITGADGAKPEGRIRQTKQVPAIHIFKHDKT